MWPSLYEQTCPEGVRFFFTSGVFFNCCRRGFDDGNPRAVIFVNLFAGAHTWGLAFLSIKIRTCTQVYYLELYLSALVEVIIHDFPTCCTDAANDIRCVRALVRTEISVLVLAVFGS